MLPVIVFREVPLTLHAFEASFRASVRIADDPLTGDLAVKHYGVREDYYVDCLWEGLLSPPTQRRDSSSE